MNPTVKKAIAGLGAWKAWEKIQEARRPEPTLWERLRRPLTLGLLGGLAYYLYRNGKIPNLGPAQQTTSSNGSYSTDNIDIRDTAPVG